MPGWRRSLSVAAVGLALLPAAAAAQSAGDNQYQDPFGDQQAQAKPTATQAPATSAPAAPATQAQAPATAAPAAPSQPAPAAGAAPAQAELPRTGEDARLPGLLGLVLLSAGVALRARARRAP